jgi:hypothetical protein
MIALILFAYVVEGVKRSGLVEFIDGDQIGVVEHVDLFELRSRSVFGGHYIKAEIGIIQDGSVALAGACGFEDNEIVSRLFADVDGFLHVFAQCPVALAGGQAAHIGSGAGDGVHPDAVAEQGSAGLFL